MTSDRTRTRLHVVATTSARGLSLLCALLLTAPGPALSQEVGDEPAAPFPGLASPRDGESLADWAAGWMEGAVVMIATEDERARFAALGSTRERLEFIRLFWERRDPQLRGPRNEYLDELSRRLEYAEERFGGGRERGWETVFGRVVVHFGIPDRERRELSLGSGLSDRPPILWSYDDALPGLEANEDLMFVFRGGRWRLFPASGFGDDGVAEQLRQIERQSLLVEIPAEYAEAMGEAIDASLAQSVDYSSAIDRVRTTVRAPESDIPFSWTAESSPAAEGGFRVTVELQLRMDSLVFQLGDDGFSTDIDVRVELLTGGEVVGGGDNRLLLTIPEADMEARREEVVRHRVPVAAPVPAGTYAVEIDLLDGLLGYRTVYTGELTVGS